MRHNLLGELHLLKLNVGQHGRSLPSWWCNSIIMQSLFSFAAMTPSVLINSANTDIIPGQKHLKDRIIESSSYLLKFTVLHVFTRFLLKK
jgi:hypothetical protein